MKKKIMQWGIGISLAILLGVLGWLAGSSQNAQKDSDNLLVVATFFPLADWARSVGSEEVSVVQIVPDGVEPHEYEPSPRDVETMLSADVLLVNGAGVDVWAENLIKDAEGAGVTVVRMSDVVPFVEISEEGHEGDFDPHAWLDIARAQEMIRAIAEAFMVEDEENIATYATHADDLRKKLGELDEKFSRTLASCEGDTVLVAHDAFHYWELRYGVEMVPISGISPEADPSVQDLARLSDLARELGITTIFFESPASSAIATTIAEEVGASVDVLYPLEGRTQEQVSSAATYTDIMEQNLSALSKALACTAP